jgi:hypothetical protein
MIKTRDETIMVVELCKKLEEANEKIASLHQENQTLIQKFDEVRT